MFLVFRFLAKMFLQDGRQSTIVGQYICHIRVHRVRQRNFVIVHMI